MVYFAKALLQNLPVKKILRSCKKKKKNEFGQQHCLLKNAAKQQPSTTTISLWNFNFDISEAISVLSFRTSLSDLGLPQNSGGFFERKLELRVSSTFKVLNVFL